MAPKKTAAESAPVSDKETVQLDREIVRRRDKQEESWAAIADALEMSQGRAMFRYMVATLDPAEAISITNEVALTRSIVKARDTELQSWGKISARTGGLVSEARIRAIYEEATGKAPSDTRIGKGGRANGGTVEGTPAKAKAPAKKAGRPAKAAPKAAAPADGVKLISEMNLEELQARLNGTTIIVKTSPNKDTRMKVAEITSLTDGVVMLKSEDGADRKVKVAQITKASKVPVSA